VGASQVSGLIVVVVAALVFFGGVISPPNLMDDVDAVQAQIARNMLESGDWVTARLDGVAYLEKSPLIYWMMAASFAVFGVHDWAARLPLAVAAVLLCWLTYCVGRWAFSQRAGIYAGVALSTSVGLWLFTRIQLPDAMLTATMILALWSVLRALDEDEPRPGWWSAVFGASLGVGLLLKGLIAILSPVAGTVLYLALGGRRSWPDAWQRIRPLRAAGIVLAIAAPWHALAAVRNPPIFEFTWRSVPGEYHGFAWFYFLNEHVFRFLNMRYPRDYNTVPRLLFWGFHMLWLFPWSFFLVGVVRLDYRPVDRSGRARLLLLCFTAFLLVFFSFSTTQEYYSMPSYPALMLLIGSAMAEREDRFSRVALAVVALALAGVLGGLAALVWNKPADGDISRALSQNPDLYTLSLGHMADLTLAAFAYLKAPLVLASVAFLAGGVGIWHMRGARMVLAPGLMMVLFFQAARLALVVFDPYLGSRALADALLKAPAGELIVDNQYYAFSSVFFYCNRRGLLLNGRVNNLEYGSYAPGAPDVFVDDEKFRGLWTQFGRRYLCVEGPSVPRIESLVGRERLFVAAESGNKFLFTNLPLVPDETPRGEPLPTVKVAPI
jgi:4-amino-4-deoxy-L-arabinose transferase-like glycosyltransferase